MTDPFQSPNAQAPFSDFAFAGGGQGSNNNGIRNDNNITTTTNTHSNTANDDIVAPNAAPPPSWVNNMQQVASQAPTRGQLKVQALRKGFNGALKTINQSVNTVGKKWAMDNNGNNNNTYNKDQPTLADRLDNINLSDDATEIQRLALEACLHEMTQHLRKFLADHPAASYEQWLAALHPDNCQIKGLTDQPLMDHRFYVKDSDHLRLWNEHVTFDGQTPDNTKPLRHAVAAREPVSSSTGMTFSSSQDATALFPSTLEHDPFAETPATTTATTTNSTSLPLQQQQPLADPFSQPADPFAQFPSVSTSEQPQQHNNNVDLLFGDFQSAGNNTPMPATSSTSQQQQQQQQPPGVVVDLLSM